MSLNQKSFEKFADMALQLDSRISEASILYNAMINEGDVPLTDENILHTGVMSNYLDEFHNGIEIQWETTWSYGGHARGTSFYNVEDLLDGIWEKSIRERAVKAIEQYRSQIKNEKNREERAERKEYEILKQKFGG